MNTYNSEFKMSGMEACTHGISYTFHWRDLGDGGYEEPDDTLANGERISG